MFLIKLRKCKNLVEYNKQQVEIKEMDGEHKNNYAM